MTTTLYVDPGDATSDEVREAWVDVLEQISRDDQARKVVEAHDADPDALAGQSVTVDEFEGDFGLTLAIGIGVPIAVHILKGLGTISSARAYETSSGRRLATLAPRATR